MGAIFAIIVFLIMVLAPIAGIWAINTLFGTAIEYTIKTWAAMVVLSGIIGSSGFRKRKE
jgi:hypothetical protein